MALSQRPGPDEKTGAAKTQVSYGPNRTVDSFYYSFAYTRLQELDWAEVMVHAKKPHVDAAVGWMGYWFQAVGFRNYDASWAPGLAYVKLDTDFPVAQLKPNIALTAGAFWPGYGYLEKYDTYTLGRFRQIGAQLKLTIPMGGFTGSVTYGFGTNRDGSFNILAPAFLGSNTALDLLNYFHLQVTDNQYFDAAIHGNSEWTADPNLVQQNVPGPKSYMAASAGHLTVVGAQAAVKAPYLGRLWVSPSYVHVRNGWALGSAGTEVMHGLGGVGVATNYLAWTGAPEVSTGSGSMINIGFLYENTLSTVLGVPSMGVGELTLNIFALLAAASLDLPANPGLADAMRPPKNITQLKYGADLTYQAATWAGLTLRYDGVNYDTSLPGFVFAAVTARASFYSHFMSGERIYLQYSRYIYGDNMVLGATFPWGQQVVFGSNVLQQGPYLGQKGDANVIKIQAEVAF